jgi:hypothetical protein
MFINYRGLVFNHTLINEFITKKQVVASACHFLLIVSCLAYSLTLKTELIHSSKTLDCLQTTQHYNQEDHTFHSRCLENLRSKLYCHCCVQRGEQKLLYFALSLMAPLQNIGCLIVTIPCIIWTLKGWKQLWIQTNVEFVNSFISTFSSPACIFHLPNCLHLMMETGSVWEMVCLKNSKDWHCPK